MNRLTYPLALDYLYGFVNYEKKMADAYTPDKMDPTRPGRLLTLLGSPHTQFPTIHIAGSKGKGSVAAICAFCLRAAGLKVGLYTSPHLQEFRERIRILTPADPDGPISQSQFASLTESLQQAVPHVAGITWFELVTALAFMHFANEKVDIAVVEVGLGGRLDATNVLTPLVSVITSLSLDHTELLGNSLAAIAGEKGGIIKPAVPVVVAPQAPEALARLEQIAQAQAAPLTLIGRDWRVEAGGPADSSGQWVRLWPADETFLPRPVTFYLPLAGRFQQQNCAVALAALSKTGRPTLHRQTVAQGLADVRWPGRLQIIHTAPTLLLDCAHNPDSAGQLAQALRQHFHYDRLWLILGITADKDMAGVLAPLLPMADGVIVTAANNPRAARPEQLQQIAADLGYTARPVTSLSQAIQETWAMSRPGDLICVTGSIFLVGDLLNQWDSLKSSAWYSNSSNHENF